MGLAQPCARQSHYITQLKRKSPFSSPVKDTTVYAHKVMLTSRCGFMSGMFSGDFTESSKDEVSWFGVTLLSKNCYYRDKLFSRV